MACVVAVRMMEVDKFVPEGDRPRVAREILRCVEEGFAEGLSAIKLGVRCFSRLCELTGCEDPYREAKAQLHHTALKFLKAGGVSNEPASLAKLALAGNSLDPCVVGYKVEELTSSVDVDESSLRKLVDALSASRRVLYVLDNMGEAVFDALLARWLCSEGKQVVVVAKGKPFETDVTLADVKRFQLAELFGDVEFRYTRDANPVFLSESRDLLEDMDLVIAKGLANYEGFLEAPVETPSALLLKVKCPVLAEKFSKPQGSYLILLENM